MLAPHEFTTGTLGDARPLSLLMPRADTEPSILIGGAPDNPVAFFLTGDRPFNGFGCKGNAAYGGFVVPEVSVEVDQTSAFDSGRKDLRLGCLVREGANLSMFMRIVDQGARPIPVMMGLPSGPEGLSIAFSRWTVGLGHGSERRVLHSVLIDMPG